MQIESALSAVLSGGSSIPLHQMAARLRPIDHSHETPNLPSQAEQGPKAPDDVVDVVELSPAALAGELHGADPKALARGSERVNKGYDAQGRPTKDGAKSVSESGATEQASTGSRNYDELSPEEQEQVDKLKARDTEVRQHEQAHLAAAGPYARGGPTYDYQTGPDGKKYAVGGEVQIDTSPIEGDPEATIRKMETVIAAALAPAEPSGQDRSVASQARAAIAQARAELTEQQRSEFDGESGEQANSNAEFSSGTSKSESTKRGAQLYGSNGAGQSANDGQDLARELDLVA